MNGRARRTVWVLALAFACAGCGDPKQQAAKALERAASDAATLQLVMAAWATERIPDHYADDAVRDVGRSLTQSVRTVERLPAGTAGREVALRPLQALAGAADRVTGAIARHDRASAAALTPIVTDLELRVRQAARAAGSTAA